jgi:sugar O-acyltransferase (sialic acid O-acetyltransferase NeuD family)
MATSRSRQAILIYGGGGSGREVAWLAQSASVSGQLYDVVGFIDDNSDAQGGTLNGIPVMSLETAREHFSEAKVVGAVGSPQLRQTLMEKASASGFEFQTIIHPRVERSEWVEIGVGTIICAGSILTTNVVIGRHVQINTACTVAHDVIIGDYATLAPGAHLSGCVHLGQRAYIGTGAVVINGTKAEPVVIGDDAVVGAGACVTKSVRPGLTVVGVPAKPRRSAGRAKLSGGM